MRRHAFLFALLGLTTVTLAAPDSLVYETGKGVRFVVTSAGLSSIRAGERELASGSWKAFNAEKWFKDGGAGVVKVGEPTEATLKLTSPKSAQVRQVQGDTIILADYRFDGEDVLISTRVENNNADAALNVVGFSGLTFHFAAPPQGEMLTQHITYFQAHGLLLCHPSGWSPIGGSYASDGVTGVGISPWKTGIARTMILWDYSDWNPGKREKLPDRKLIYFANIPVPARGAATYDLRLRVSPNIDWHHLLEPYREHFQATFGKVQYHADQRWIATDYLNHSQQAVSPTNPYGFHGGYRRIDTPAGAAQLCETLIPKIHDGNGQGLILWGQGGDDPRGAMYRPDFDILPPSVEQNWHILADGFKNAGLKLGVCTRPRDMALRRDFKSDEIVSINPEDPSHREMLLARFTNMAKHGCTLFYLDSFGDSFEDVKLMRYLRKELGPDVLTFAEHQCDAIMPYTGGYSETTGSPTGYSLWSGVGRWEIYQFLCPGSQMAARLFEIKTHLPEQNADMWYLSHQITPLLPANDFSRITPLKALQEQALTPEKQWRQAKTK